VGGGDAFTAALKIYLIKRGLHSYYHQKIIENNVFTETPEKSLLRYFVRHFD
jgi:hypothetical protein